MAWFKDQEPGVDYIIIDDDKSLNSLPEHLKQRLILTSPMIGLTTEDTEPYQQSTTVQS